MSNVYDTAEQFKARLFSRERRAASLLVRAYGVAYLNIKRKLDDLAKEIEAARLAGETVPVGWLYERGRLASLKAAMSAELRRFSEGAARVITDEQRAALRLGLSDSRTLVVAALEAEGLSVTANFGGLNRNAVEALAGFASDGSPLATLLNEAGRRAGERARLALVSGVAEGASADVIARRFRDAFGGGMARSLTIARTETLRSYREAAREVYRASSDVLDGWVWTASLSRRTCAMCLAMHGQVFSVEERLESHPNCRCVQVPLVTGGDDSGIKTGDVWLEAQAEEIQRAVLGDAKFDLFKSGRLRLRDLVGERRDRRWGFSRFEKPLHAVK
ncbi:MAG: phage head morphogenesis protein [Acidobacteria bacterium]|nr:phage head morphogenesis protein [Acidobacteriota bacterium]MCA1620699.1 phage head morphogenesis protein [Acidobacteriota bacterium]